MSNEKEEIIRSLASLFLRDRDMDRAYFKIIKEIRSLSEKEVFVDINEVQEFAYEHLGVR
jgi:hypothetical protein